MNTVKKQVKSLVERSLGVTISRTPQNNSTNKHSDHALRNMRNWSGGDVVFDVGANDGRTILRIREQLSSPRFYAFEPVSSTYRTLVERTRPFDSVRCFQCALGAEPGRKAIYVNEIDSMSSFSPTWGTAVRTETVEVKTVDQVMSEQGLDFIHYLKIDTEGFELEVLKGAKEALSASRIAIIQVEVGFGQTKHEFSTLQQVMRHLAPMGYLLSGIYNQCHVSANLPPQWNSRGMIDGESPVLVYCDALFIRADA